MPSAPGPDAATDLAAGDVAAGDVAAGDVAAGKQRLRREMLNHRRRRDPQSAAVAERALTDILLAAPELAGLGPGCTVAGYLPLPGEPSPLKVLEALSTGGVTVLLPVLLPDGDLDWAPAGPPGSFPDSWPVRAARAGTTSPAGPPRGPESIVDVRAVLVPGVAGDANGRRLGRGGGSYDRALARLDGAAPDRPAGDHRPWTCLLLWPDEVVPAVPAAAHDRRVDAVATADGLLRVGPRG